MALALVAFYFFGKLLQDSQQFFCYYHIMILFMESSNIESTLNDFKVKKFEDSQHAFF
jgi:hypothetical protein